MLGLFHITSSLVCKAHYDPVSLLCVSWLTFSRQKVVMSESVANVKHDCSWPQLTNSTVSYFSFYICIPTIFLMSVVTSFSHQNQFDFNVWPKTIKTLATAVQYPQIKNGCIGFYHIFILKAKKQNKKGTKHKISRGDWFKKWVVTTTWLIIFPGPKWCSISTPVSPWSRGSGDSGWTVNFALDALLFWMKTKWCNNVSLIILE